MFYFFFFFFFLMIRRPPRSTQSRSSAASDVYKRQGGRCEGHMGSLSAGRERRNGNEFERRRRLIGMRERPLIGVTTSEVRRAETVESTPEGEPPRHEMALGLTYMRAIEWAGGIPVVIPPLH